MKQPAIRHLLLLSATLVAGGSLALLAGCKGNTSAAAVAERVIPAPPMVEAYMGTPDLAVGPLQHNSVWAGAHWMPLVSPANTERTTAPVAGAIMYDADHLYVAFISQKATGNVSQDTVSAFLDCTPAGHGEEILKVTVNASGLATCMWIRDAEPPLHARDDGTPDMVHPLSKIPNLNVQGFFAKTGTGTQNGAAVWTAVAAIPLKSLPMPLRADPAPGTHWKVNLLRNTIMVDTGDGAEQLQANLSPVYVGAQAVSPYRLANLVLTNAQISSAPVATSANPS